MSLRWRIALALALVAGVIGSFATLGSYVTTARQVRDSIDESLLTRAAAAAVPGRGRPRGPGADDCPAPAALVALDAAQLVDPDGTVVDCLGNAVDLPVEPRLLDAEPGEFALSTERVGDERFRVLGVTLRDGSVLQIARDLDESRRVLGALRTRLAALAVAGVAAAGLLGLGIARRIVRPVVELRDAAETIARTQDLRTPIPAGGSGEVGSLAGSLTTMVNALAASRDQQHRLIADASHEMRTPLTSLRTNSELLAHFDRLDATDRADTLAAVQVDVHELTNLLTELVELATDRTGTDEPVEPLDLAELAGEVAARAARRSGREIVVVPPVVHTLVPGRPRMLERAISNLVDNALKYGGPGRIEVVVTAGRVEVRDEGPGIPAADLPHVFERFYRATTARSAPGSGLGLAIVEQIAARHGGRVWAENRPGGTGAAVGFEVPAEPSGSARA